METKREAVKEIANKINYADLFKSPSDIKVESLWRIYAALTFEGIEVSAVQYRETKQAFYIGFLECFRMFTDITEKFSEEQASEILSALVIESSDFVNSTLDRKFGN
jgi:hypothetical protein